MDNAIVMVVILFGLLIVFIASGMWIGIAMGLVGALALFLWVGGGKQSVIGVIQFNSINTFIYTALPLFIFMGEIILRSGMSDKLYKGATSWVGFLPGGLLHTNIASCALFAAISGSSMATAATIGTVAVPELEKRGYDRRLVLGSLAAGGTLGILIPPSVGMIIYGAQVGESIGKLFIAGIFPGLTLAGLFMAYIGVRCIRNPHLAPDRPRFSLKELGSSVFLLAPVMVLIFMVLGSIYLGLATPTESAALGAFVATVFCALYRKLNWQVIKVSALAAAEITSWAVLIIVGAEIFSNTLSFLGIPLALANMVASLAVHRVVILYILVLLYILMGMFMDPIAMMLLTLPVVFPIIITLGFDPIWFGVMMVVFIEMGQITPPVGVNLFIIHGITGKRYLGDIIRGIIPFFFCQVVLVILLTAFPSLATWLPKQMMSR